MITIGFCVYAIRNNILCFLTDETRSAVLGFTLLNPRGGYRGTNGKRRCSNYVSVYIPNNPGHKKIINFLISHWNSNINKKYEYNCKK